MDLSTAELLRVFFDAVESESPELPVGLEQRVLAAGLGREKPLQHTGWQETDSTELSPLTAFIKTADELADLVCALTPDEWNRATRVTGATVRNIVEHLVGVERYVLGQLGRRPQLDAPRREDHWLVTQLAVRDLAEESTSVVFERWWLELLEVLAACGELGPEHELSYHHLVGTLRGLLVVRTFELWTHGDDIREATGRPFYLLDEARLSMMASELMRVLPFGLALSGCAQPGHTARFQLTGLDRTFDVPLAPGEAPGTPDIALTVDAIDLCRLASNRLAREAFDITVEGDRRLLEPILVGASAFAAD